jgi:hypothetical protein
MNTLQDLRYKLQKRVARLETVGPDGLGNELIRFFDFFDSNAMFRACAASLRASYSSIEKQIDEALTKHEMIEGVTEAESAAIGQVVLRRAAVPDNGRFSFTQYVNYTASISEMLDRFREAFVSPFYEYLDEHIEDRNIVLAELMRFKHLAEWFRAQELWDKWKRDSKTGERRLAFSVYEFLYEQGVEFHIEPASASGEADMVAAQGSTNPLVADVKIFDPDSARGASYIKRGIHQVYHYLQDFHQPIGYLLVFKGTPKLLDLQFSGGSLPDVPSVTIGDKTIFVVQVDIYPHEESASKRPIPDRETIAEAELRSEIQSGTSPSPDQPATS